MPVLVFAGELPEEEDNQFNCWVYVKLILSGKMAIRASTCVSDVRLERMVRFEYSKFTAKGQLRSRSSYDSATLVAAGFGRILCSNSCGV